MDLGLNGKRALVGGGASGLGAGIATVVAGEGARVMLVGRTQEKLEAAASAIGASSVVADLSRPDGPPSAVQAGSAAQSPVAGLVRLMPSCMRPRCRSWTPSSPTWG